MLSSQAVLSTSRDEHKEYDRLVGDEGVFILGLHGSVNGAQQIVCRRRSKAHMELWSSKRRFWWFKRCSKLYAGHKPVAPQLRNAIHYKQIRKDRETPLAPSP
jgi:hypothetical protein